MACSGAFGATAQRFADFWCIGDNCAEARETIETYLEVAATDVYAALASVGACDCTLADWAQGYLQKLVLIDAASYYNCPCANPRLNTDQKSALLQWMGTQLSNIATGVIDVCDGATGAGLPSMGWAQQSNSGFAAAIICTVSCGCITEPAMPGCSIWLKRFTAILPTGPAGDTAAM